MAKGQRQRAHKTSNGSSIGARKNPQSELNLVLMGKGMAHRHTSKKK